METFSNKGVPSGGIAPSVKPLSESLTKSPRFLWTVMERDGA